MLSEAKSRFAGKEIIFASKNEGKVKEVRHILNGINAKILSLNDIGFKDEIPETAYTFEGNAKIKADAVYNRFKLPTIADDSGIVAVQLGNEPGVFSARFAGENATDEANNKKLLEKLNDFPEPHRAKFVCAAVYYFGADFFTAIGEVEGVIIKQPRGANGFGYDPLFLPNGYDKTTAELPPEIKNKISHRFKAFDQLKKYLMEL
ncbi:MAG: RdgB/HAM1 family non-canonical purine NTP pyrophosphatase [Ignavibacteriaceae bacterium]|nr:RdgB/HAM1 family non-canonical purine NTP pyrophosphatase [Ignavibacteriaceae bacterium]